MIPPFGGAMVRFVVEFNGRICSVYLDCYDNLGFVGSPYWEVYPGDDNTNTARLALADVEGLMYYINKSLTSLKSDA